MNRTPSQKQTRSTRLIVPNAIGLHARPAAMLTRTALEYDAKIVMECGRRSVNAKSIMGILTLCAGQGAEITVTAQGHDAEEAIRAIECLFVCAFHDEAPAMETAFCGMERQTAGVSRQRVGGACTAAAPAAPG